ncbi:hypothetical protein [Novosphingobium sp.]|uniref:hypothetical protein n=1 Tax=Novosphingobium sp. TaxID=1874826 RepID=UPI0038B74160
MCIRDRDGPEHAGAGRWHHRGPGPEGLLGPADADHDKVVTRAEYDAATKARFDRADTNHDGTLSEAELRAGFARMRARDGEAIGGLRGAPGGFPPPPPPPPSAGQ